MEKERKIYGPHDIFPSEPIHPGEILKDELEARNISEEKFAEMMGVPHAVVNEIVKGKRAITAEDAFRIEAATGIEKCMWMEMQMDYDIQTAKRDKGLLAVLEKIRKAAAVL